MIFGIVFFSKILRSSLDKKRSATVWMIIGMMLGSIYSICIGPLTLDMNPLNIHTFSILYFLLGGIIIFSLEGLKSIVIKK